MATIIATRNAKDLTVVAEIDFSLTAEVTLTAVDRGVESHSIADRHIRNFTANLFDNTGSFVPHHKRWNSPSATTIVPVNVATTDAASGNADQHCIGSQLGLRHVGNF